MREEEYKAHRRLVIAAGVVMVLCCIIVLGCIVVGVLRGSWGLIALLVIINLIGASVCYQVRERNKEWCDYWKEH